jgi:hypothetical protein
LLGNLNPTHNLIFFAKTKGNDWVRRVAKKHPENHCDRITCGAQFTPHPNRELHPVQPGLLLNITANLNPHTHTLYAICNCHRLHPQATVIFSSLSHKCGRNSWHEILTRTSGGQGIPLKPLSPGLFNHFQSSRRVNFTEQSG